MKFRKQSFCRFINGSSQGLTLVELLLAMGMLSVIILAVSLAGNQFLKVKMRTNLGLSADAIEIKLRYALSSPEIMRETYAKDSNLAVCSVDSSCTVTGASVPLTIYAKTEASAASEPLFPDPNSASNNCLMDDGSTFCTCGSSAFCRWRVRTSYVVESSTAVRITGIISLYTPSGAASTEVSDRRVEMTLSGSNLSVTPERTPGVYPCPSQSSSILVGYNIDGSPICRSVDLDCSGTAEYVTGINSDGSYTCGVFP